MWPERLRTKHDLEALLREATNYEERMPAGDAERAFDLSRMRALLAAIGDPQEGPETFHVTGSKGKGSTARMVDACLRAAGRGPVGLYVSPHLERIEERVCVNGTPVAGDDLAAAAEALMPHLRATRGTERFPTFFEILTAAAHVAFRARGVRSAVLEVGLGGRLDATNVCRPTVTAITTVELEHVRILGDTLEKIAAEKSGIVKPGVPCVTAVPAGSPASVVIERACAAAGAPLLRLGREFAIESASTGPGPWTRVVVSGPAGAPPLRVEMPVAGLHQARNAAVAIAAARLLRVSDGDVAEGLKDLRLPGRMETVIEQPRLVIDAAHTASSARAAREALDACWPGAGVHLVLGVLEDKDVAGILAPLVPKAASVVCCAPRSPRSWPAERLAEAVRALAPGVPVSVATDASEAVGAASRAAGPGDVVLVAGSTYLAGEARAAARRHPGFLPLD
jgi:dihydrofolate synthase/folylpolyglutamate synthase